MMPLEAAAVVLIRMANFLYLKTESIEQERHMMYPLGRNQIGAIRCALNAFGMDKSRLPQTPYLDPEHLRSYEIKVNENRIKRKLEKEAKANEFDQG